MELEALGGRNKTNMLRELITEKLTIAAQQIFAAVERTVAAYEDEASGFRREIDRQRRQLEADHQPEIKVETTDIVPDADEQLLPVSEPEQGEPARGGRDLSEDEEQHKYEPSVGFTSYAEQPMEEDADEQPAQIPTRDQEPITELDYETTSSSLPPSAQSDRRSGGRRRVTGPQTHVGLRIRILEDSQIDVLSVNVFKKFPLHELQCPRGLQESDFLNLLRATYPQLAAHQPFDFFMTDKSKRLQPLLVNELTPEEISKAIRSSGSGHSALYIRLKAQEEPPANHEEFGPSPSEEAAADSSSISSHSASLLGLSPELNHSGRQSSKRQTRVALRVRVLDDSHIDRLTWTVFQKYPVKELHFPRGLQEADFLNQLRSSFPQLAADKPFDVFMTDKSRKLQPLKAKTLTPEEIHRTIRSTGNSALYIRLKSPEELQARKKQKHFHLVQKTKAAAKDSPSASDRTRLESGVQSDRKTPGRRETQKHIDLRIRFLKDSQTDVLTGEVFQKYPVQELQCPRGLQEAEFLDLLRSTFPQLAADEPFEIFTLDKSKRLFPLKVNTVTPEEIHRTVRSNKPSALYIQIKAKEEAQTCVENMFHRKDDASKYCPSTSEEARPDMSVSAQENKEHKVKDLSISSQQDTEAEEAGAVDQQSSRLWPLQSPLAPDSERDVDELSTRNDKWKPDSDAPMKSRESGNANRSRALHSDAPLSCKVCRARRGSTKTLTKHAWSHVDDPKRLCGVCGERFETAEALRSHLQSHLKTHSCSICGKSLLSITGLKGHIARHKGRRTYKCKTCNKAFIEKSMLSDHMWAHAVEKRHRCDICQKACVSKVKLKLHMVTHTDKKLYSCSTCRKPFHKLEAYSRHVADRCGLAPVRATALACQTCGKHFYSGRRLKLHMRSHSSERQHVCAQCNKRFPDKTSLMLHMRLHAAATPAPTDDGPALAPLY